MGAPHPAAPQGNRQAVNPADAELLKAFHATHHVHQYVQSANFVEGDLVRRLAMYPTLGLADQL